MNPLGPALATPPAGTIGLAVAYSGGLDSTALLHALRDAQPDSALRALHVCHHLQPDAERWADHCAAQCGALGVRFLRLDVAVDVRDGGMEAAARAARYAALADTLAPGETLVCAHHAEDQAETFLLQALRGAGVAGLAAMPRLAALGEGRLWRPWLAIERSAIRAYAQAHGLRWIGDPSNVDIAVARGYVRRALWPALTARWPAASRTLARSAAWAAEAADAVAALAAIDVEAARCDEGSLAIAVLRGLSDARQREALRRWLAERGRDTPDHRHVAEIRRLFEADAHAGPRVCFSATEVRVFDDRLFAMAALAPPPQTAIAWCGKAPLALPGDAGRLIQTAGRRVPLSVRFRQGGERLVDARGRSRSLKRLLQRHRMPPWIRERMPLIYRDGELLAVADRWRSPQCTDERAPPYFQWAHALPGDTGADLD